MPGYMVRQNGNKHVHVHVMVSFRLVFAVLCGICGILYCAPLEIYRNCLYCCKTEEGIGLVQIYYITARDRFFFVFGPSQDRVTKSC